MNTLRCIIRFVPVILLFVSLIFVPFTYAQDNTQADLNVTLSTSASNVTDNFQYFVTFSNQGPDTASNVVINFPLPKGTQGYVSHVISASPGGCNLTDKNIIQCTFSNLASGSGGRVDVNVYTIRGRSRLISVTATISSESSDPNTNNNSSTASVLFTRNTQAKYFELSDTTGYRTYHTF